MVQAKAELRHLVGSAVVAAGPDAVADRKVGSVRGVTRASAEPLRM